MSSAIPFDKIEIGIDQALKNSTRFLEDSILLFENQRYQSAILLAMLSYEESGKTLMLLNYKKNEIELTQTQWKKKVCVHTKKNLEILKQLWSDAGIQPKIPLHEEYLSKFQQEWKNIFTYVDYDFTNLKWTSPMSPKSFNIDSLKSFSKSAIDQATKALELVTKQVKR